MVLRLQTIPILIAVVVLGALLRFYSLTSLPPSLNWDEVSHGYNAYSLLHSGHDQWGQILPIINFRAFGDYPTALNLYFTVPAIAIFGPTDWAARLPHALIGTLTIPVVFYAAYMWRRNRVLALIAALLIAIDPWTLFTSRTVLQANWAVFFLSLGLGLFLAKRYQSAVLVWLVSLLAYHNTRIFVPLLLAALGVGYRKSVILTVVVIGIAGAILLSPTSRVRGTWVGIINPASVSTIEYMRNHSTLPPLATRLLYNRPTYFASKVANNYLGYFSPQFLFLSGGTQYQYSLPKMGLTSAVNLPFFYLGLLLAIPATPILLIWLLLSPLPAAITVDQFAVVRATTLLPVVQLTIASGLVWLTTKFPGRWRLPFLTVYLVGLVISLGLFLHNYTQVYPTVYSASWQYGYHQAVDYVKSNYDKYDQIVFTKRYGEPHEFVAWYWPWPATNILSDPNFKWDYHDGWYWVDGFGKFRFVNDWEMANYVASLPLGNKYLIVASPDHPTQGTELKKINFLNSQPAFIIKEL